MAVCAAVLGGAIMFSKRSPEEFKASADGLTGEVRKEMKPPKTPVKR